MFYLNVIIPYQQYPFTRFQSLFRQIQYGSKLKTGGELINSKNLEKDILI